MNDLKKTFGNGLPYSEPAGYVNKLLERCRDRAIAEAPRRRKNRAVSRLWLSVAGAAAVVAIVATVALRLTSMTSGGNGDDAVLCSVETVEQSAPLSVVLASMTDDQLADVSYYSTDDIPEY